MADVVAFELRDDARGSHARGEPTDVGTRVDEHFVAEIQTPTVERGHFWSTRERTGTFVDGHAHGSACGHLDDAVATLTYRIHHFGEALRRLSVASVVGPHVQVNHRSAGFATASGLLGDLSGGKWDVGTLSARNFGP